MAGFEGLEKMTDKLEKEHLTAKLKSDADDQFTRLFNSGMAEGYLNSLVLFYETALQHGKFISQRKYCELAIKRMNPAFAEGYFKGKK